ncbi:Gfo/Idh/MocA family protein [uncultured Microbacterium sp.]|uniref:Gfo/Idh/MocA family protein n=1 Tax=uncultured Microbacterium sp. TaxID=191216 RepID=UPI0035CBAE91
MNADQRPLGVAVVGGWHVHAQDYGRQVREASGARLEAVWDDDRERGAAIAHALGVAFVDDLTALLNSPGVEGVVVTEAPSRKHETLATCLRAGKHVLSEKLVALSVDGFDALTSIADANHASLSCAMPFLGRRALVEMIAAARAGSVGEITAIRANLSIDGVTAGWLPPRFDDPDEAVVGTMGDLGCHPVYLINELVDEDPIAISATYGRTHGRNLDTNSIISMLFQSGVVATASSSHVEDAGHNTCTLDVTGTKGELRFALDAPTQFTVRRSDETLVHSCAATTEEPVETWLKALPDAGALRTQPPCSAAADERRS